MACGEIGVGTNRFHVFTGLEGSAEAVVPLDEETVAGVKADSQLGKSFTGTLSAASEDIGFLTKLMIFGVIVGLCVLFVKMNSPRRTGYAGRHGAYEKGGLP